MIENTIVNYKGHTRNSFFDVFKS